MKINGILLLIIQSIFNFGGEGYSALEVVGEKNTNHTFNSEIKIYPNPTENRLYISDPLRAYKVELYDLEGRKVMVVIARSVINTTALEKGMYLIKLFDGEKLVYSSKVVKIK